MITVYHATPLANSGKVLIALHEKGIAFESRWINLHRFEQHEPWFLELNPDGQVPVLDHHGLTIVHTTVINEYLEDAFPDTPALRPADPAGKARMRHWNKYIDDNVMQAVSIHGWQHGAGATARKIDPATFETYVARIPLEAQRVKWRTARAGFPQADLDAGTGKVRQAVATIERQLTAGPWIVGDMFTLADINFYAYCGGALEIMFPEIGNRQNCPRVMDWVDRMRARPGVAAALAMKAPEPA